MQQPMKETRVPEPVVDILLSAMECYSFLRNFCKVLQTVLHICF